MLLCDCLQILFVRICPAFQLSDPAQEMGDTLAEAVDFLEKSLLAARSIVDLKAIQQLLQAGVSFLAVCKQINESLSDAVEDPLCCVLRS